MRSWVDRYRDDRARVEIELAECGTSLEILVKDLEDVSELRETVARLKDIRDGEASEEALRILALRHFGDEGHPQPEKRSVHYESNLWGGSRTPDWGRLRRREEGTSQHEGSGNLGGSNRKKH